MRLRSLGNGYTEKDIEKRIAGEEIEDVTVGSNKAVSVKTTKEKTEQKLDVVLDIQNIIAKNKGPGYEQWAKRHNIKAISKTLIFLSERGLESYRKLTAVASEATEKFDSITTRQKEIEKRMSEIKELRQHIFNYAKSKKIYAEYKSKKYDGPIPTIRELDEEFQKLLQEKHCLIQCGWIFSLRRQQSRGMRHILNIIFPLRCVSNALPKILPNMTKSN